MERGMIIWMLDIATGDLTSGYATRLPRIAPEGHTFLMASNRVRAEAERARFYAAQKV